MEEKVKIDEIVKVLEEIKNDVSIPKNVKEKVNTVMNLLKGDCDVKICVNKALHELDDVTDDPNMDGYARSLIWNVVSLLENVC